MTDDAADRTASQVPHDRPLAERIIPENLPLIYTNIAAIGSSVWDFSFDFGVITGTTESGGIRFEDRVRVVMSPQQAQVFSELLTHHINQYKQTFGPIPRPPQTEDSGEVVVVE
jgi:Protein of unknown function (DUF3467)